MLRISALRPPLVWSPREDWRKVVQGGGRRDGIDAFWPTRFGKKLEKVVDNKFPGATLYPDGNSTHP
jgi:hypothetical protein